MNYTLTSWMILFFISTVSNVLISNASDTEISWGDHWTSHPVKFFTGAAAPLNSVYWHLRKWEHNERGAHKAGRAQTTADLESNLHMGVSHAAREAIKKCGRGPYEIDNPTKKAKVVIDDSLLLEYHFQDRFFRTSTSPHALRFNYPGEQYNTSKLVDPAHTNYDGQVINQQAEAAMQCFHESKNPQLAQLIANYEAGMERLNLPSVSVLKNPLQAIKNAYIRFYSPY
jgi:hypothetical protein